MKYVATKRKQFIWAICLAFVFVLAATYSQSQLNRTRDSLLSRLKATTHDTLRVQLYLALAKVDLQRNSLPYCRISLASALQLSKQIGYATGEAMSYLQMSQLMAAEKRLDSANYFARRCVEFCSRRSLPDLAVQGFNALAANHQEMGVADSSLHYYQQAVIFLKANQQQNGLAPAFYNLQTAYTKLGQHDNGIKHGRQSLQLYSADDNLNGAARVLKQLGDNYRGIAQYDSAVHFYQQAFMLSSRFNDSLAMAHHLHELGSAWLQQQNVAEAQPYFERSLSIAKAKGLYALQVQSATGLATCHLYQSQLDSALALLQQAAHMATQQGFDVLLKDCLRVKAAALYASGNLEAGEACMRDIKTVEDRIAQDLVQKENVRLETLYAFEQKNHQISLQQSQLARKSLLSYFGIGSAFSILVLFVLTYFIYQHRRKIKEKQLAEMERRQQLSVTEALLRGEEEERIRLASDIHEGLGGMLSGVKFSLGNLKERFQLGTDDAATLQRNIDLLNNTIVEMRRVAHNMMPEALVNFGLDVALKDYCHEIAQSGIVHVSYQTIGGVEDLTLSPSQKINLYRIVQELVGNVLKHAGAKSILVQLEKHADSLQILVEDDGQGMDWQVAKDMGGIGWNNLRNRVELLKGSIQVESEKNVGTTVRVRIPI